MASPWSVLRRSWALDMRDNQERVIEAVRRGDFLPLEWRTIRIQHPTDPLLVMHVQAMHDALRIGTPSDFVRVTVTHRTAQAVADMLGVVMPTAKLGDENDRAALERLEPQVWLQTAGAPSDVATMEADSQAIDAALEGKPPLWLSGPWKLWVNHRRLARPQQEILGKRLAINYGGWTKNKATPPGVPGPKPSVTRIGRNVYQEPGGFHDVDHVDESQKFWGLNPLVSLLWGGDESGVADVWKLVDIGPHPDLWPLVSHDGPVLMRHPWLTELPKCFDGGTCPAPFVPSGGSAPPTPRTRMAASGVVVAASAALLYAVLRWL